MLFRSNDTATTEIYTLVYTLSLHDALPIWQRNTAHRPTHGHGYGNSGSYGYGGAVYPGPYGNPDVIHSGGGHGGGGYGGGYRDAYGHDHSNHGYGRDPQRIGWCCAEYRSYDPNTGYYVAYSGERVFCG